MAGISDLFNATPIGMVYNGLSGKNPFGEDTLGSAWNFLSGDPKGVKAAYDQALGQNQMNGQQMRDLLSQGKSQALGFYTPIQDMYKRTYGVGLKPQGTR